MEEGERGVEIIKEVEERKEKMCRRKRRNWSKLRRRNIRKIKIKCKRTKKKECSTKG